MASFARPAARLLTKRALGPNIAARRIVPSVSSFAPSAAAFQHTIASPSAALDFGGETMSPPLVKAPIFHPSELSQHAKGKNVPKLPEYLVSTYHWAYISDLNVPWLDNDLVVNTILFGNEQRLTDLALAELEPGMKVLQPAAVYGSFSRLLAEKLGPEGHLLVSDVTPIQLRQLGRKVKHLNNVSMALTDARYPVGGPFDAVCCFFLLHEVPDDVKADIVKALFANIRPGGKVVFCDYHMYNPLHPLRPLMKVVFDTLEPFAWGVCKREIKEYCPNPEKYEWKKETIFGGLYQKVVATCKLPKEAKKAE